MWPSMPCPVLPSSFSPAVPKLIDFDKRRDRLSSLRLDVCVGGQGGGPIESPMATLLYDDRVSTCNWGEFCVSDDIRPRVSAWTWWLLVVSPDSNLEMTPPLEALNTASVPVESPLAPLTEATSRVDSETDGPFLSKSTIGVVVLVLVLC